MLVTTSWEALVITFVRFPLACDYAWKSTMDGTRLLNRDRTYNTYCQERANADHAIVDRTESPHRVSRWRSSILSNSGSVVTQIGAERVLYQG